MGRTIFLKSNMYAPRLNWRFCHELAHILLNHGSSDRVSYEQELEAERLAGEIMLPPGEFRALMRTMSILELYEYYSHVSWEALCRRWAENKPAVLTIFDNEKMTYRKGPEGFVFPVAPVQFELELVRKCFEEKGHLDANVNELNMQVFFVDSGQGVRRVLLLTEFPDYT